MTIEDEGKFLARERLCAMFSTRAGSICYTDLFVSSNARDISLFLLH